MPAARAKTTKTMKPTKPKRGVQRAWARDHVDIFGDPEEGIAALAAHFRLRVVEAVQVVYEACRDARDETGARAPFILRLEQSDSVGAFAFAKTIPFVVDGDAPRLAAGPTVRIGDVVVPRLALGSMRLVSSAYQHDDRWHDALGLPFNPEENRHALLNAFHACGIRSFDIARGYGPWPGAGESFLREWTAPLGDAPLIATKVGYRRAPDGAWLVDLDPDVVRADTARSVRRLGGHVPLLYLVLRSTPDVRVLGRPVDLRASIAPLVEAQRAGHVGRIGLANATCAEIEALSTAADIVAVQNNFTLAAFQDDEKRAAFDLCRARALPFVMWGLFGQDAWPRPAPDPRLAEDAAALGASHQELTIALLLASAPNVVVLPGASRRETIYSSVRGANFEVPRAVLRRHGVAKT